MILLFLWRYGILLFVIECDLGHLFLVVHCTNKFNLLEYWISLYQTGNENTFHLFNTKTKGHFRFEDMRETIDYTEDDGNIIFDWKESHHSENNGIEGRKKNMLGGLRSHARWMVEKSCGKFSFLFLLNERDTIKNSTFQSMLIIQSVFFWGLKSLVSSFCACLN